MPSTLEKIIASGLIFSGCKDVVSDTAQDVSSDCLWVDSYEQQKGTNKIDALWIVNKASASMDEQQKMVYGMLTTMNALTPADWLMNAVATDPDVAQSGLVPLEPGTTYEELETFFNNIDGGSFLSDNGLEAAMAHVETQSWMRPDAALVLFFASREDDESFKDMSDSEAMLTFGEWFDSVREYRYIASVVPQQSSYCPNENLGVGERYIEVAEDFDGELVDYCDELWTDGVWDGARQVSAYGYKRLKHNPVPDTITIFVDNSPYTLWTYNESANSILYIESPPVKSSVQIAYDVDLATVTECPSNID